jgi:hypothetical protein
VIAQGNALGKGHNNPGSAEGAKQVSTENIEEFTKAFFILHFAPLALSPWSFHTVATARGSDMTMLIVLSTSCSKRQMNSRHHSSPVKKPSHPRTENPLFSGVFSHKPREPIRPQVFLKFPSTAPL